MNRKIVGGSVLVAGLAAAGAAGYGVVVADGEKAGAAQSPVRFAEVDVFAEINRTDGDVALLMTLSAEDDWRHVAVTDPRGRRILDLRSRANLRRQGLIGLELESGERAFDEVPLSKFKGRFPKGRYVFRGVTTGGRRIVGSARLSHSIPGGPRITAPAANSTIAPTGVVVRWNAPAGPKVSTYQVLVAGEETEAEIAVTLPASARSLPLPEGFLERNETYVVEVIAVAESGNKGIREQRFKTSR